MRLTAVPPAPLVQLWTSVVVTGYSSGYAVGSHPVRLRCSFGSLRNFRSSSSPRSSAGLAAAAVVVNAPLGPIRWFERPAASAALRRLTYHCSCLRASPSRFCGHSTSAECAVCDGRTALCRSLVRDSFLLLLSLRPLIVLFSLASRPLSRLPPLHPSSFSSSSPRQLYVVPRFYVIP